MKNMPVKKLIPGHYYKLSNDVRKGYYKNSFQYPEKIYLFLYSVKSKKYLLEYELWFLTPSGQKGFCYSGYANAFHEGEEYWWSEYDC